MDALPAAGRPTVPGNPFGGVEKPSGPRLLVCLRAQPFDPLRVIPPFVCFPMGRRFVGIESRLADACPCYGVEATDMRHVQIGPRAGTQVNQHRSLINAMA